MRSQFLRNVALAGFICGALFPLLFSDSQSPEWKSLRFFYDAKKMGLTVLKFSLSIERRDSRYCVTASFRTIGIARPFFRMDTTLRSYVKEGSLEPVSYEREVNEKRFLSKAQRFKEILYFHPEDSKILAVRGDPPRTREVSVPPQTRDPLAMFLNYYLGAEVRVGDQVTLTIYDGVNLRDVSFSAAREEIPTRLFGRIQTMCVKTRTFFSTFDYQEGTIKAWYTTDERRYPVQISIDLPSLGTITFVLVKVEVR
ncbi:MAG: DUF3108 domain-containing protein [Candidatus Aminicenantes bacterium]|nr:DUF3108 domain-containing protein [Candidatus Aminicenantes bacterium]